MNNTIAMQQFLATYRTEIAALIEDLHLQDVHICYDGRQPDGLDEDLTVLWEWWDIDQDAGHEPSMVIALAWDNIINDGDDLRYGLIVLAQCLRNIAMERVTILEYRCDTCRHMSYGEACQDATDYAYEAVQRLFTLFPNDEVEAMIGNGCPCKRCRKKAWATLDRSAPQRTEQAREATDPYMARDGENRDTTNDAGSTDHKERTHAFFEAYRNEVLLILEERGIPGWDFSIDTINKPLNENFSEIVITPDLGFRCRLDWDMLPTNLSREQTFRIAACEVMKNVHLVWQIKDGCFDGFLPNDRVRIAREYVDEIVKDFAEECPESRFAELIQWEHHTMSCINDAFDDDAYDVEDAMQVAC